MGQKPMVRFRSVTGAFLAILGAGLAVSVLLCLGCDDSPAPTGACYYRISGTGLFGSDTSYYCDNGWGEELCEKGPPGLDHPYQMDDFAPNECCEETGGYYIHDPDDCDF